MKRWNTRALFAATWLLGGCNLLVGLDEVSLVQNGDGGAPASGGAGPSGSGGATSGTALPGDGSMTDTGADTTSPSTGGGDTVSSTGGGDTVASPDGSGGDTTTTSTGGGDTTGTGTGGGSGGGDTTSSSSSSSSSSSGAGGGMPMPCGDGVLAAGEQCDDGNSNGGDGCSSECHIEPFYQCTTFAPSLCYKQEVLCNDGADSDGDGLTDAADPDCALPPYAMIQSCLSLRIYRSVNVPVTIPDSGQVWSPVFVHESFALAHTAVVLDITHSYTGDLDILLAPPFGPPRNLSSDNGGNGDNYTATYFATDCPSVVMAGAAPFHGCYKPEASLPGNGQQAQGTWELAAGDDTPGETGTLDGWVLVLCAQ